MPLEGQAFTEVRNIIPQFTAGVNLPIDAIKACVKFIEQTEAQYAIDPASVVDLTSVDLPLVGRSRFKVHYITVTLVIATGTYTFDYNESAANIDSLS